MEENKQEECKKLSKKQNFFQVLKYTGFAISAGVIQIAVDTFLKEVCGFSYWLSYLPALILSVVWNFTFNRKYTFKSSNNVPIAMAKVALYYVIFTPLSTWWMDALELAGWNNYLALALTMIINFVTEFLYSKFFVFKEQKKEKNNE